MAANWDLKMQGRFETLATTVGDFGKRFDAVDRRFDVVDRRLDAVDQRFDAVDRRLDAVDRRFDAVDRRFDAVDERIEDLGRKIDVHMDDVRELVQKAAEGYGATLDGIARAIKEFRSEWRTKADDTDMVLGDHGRRITALEQRAPK